MFQRSFFILSLGTTRFTVLLLPPLLLHTEQMLIIETSGMTLFLKPTPFVSTAALGYCSGIFNITGFIVCRVFLILNTLLHTTFTTLNILQYCPYKRQTSTCTYYYIHTANVFVSQRDTKRYFRGKKGIYHIRVFEYA